MKQHPLDPLALLLGLAFLAGSALWVAWDQADAGRNAILVAVPVILIVAGLVGIALSSVAAHRRKGKPDE